MADFSGKTRERMLEWYFNFNAPAKPTGYFISFHTDDPLGSDQFESALFTTRTEQALWATGTVDDGIVQNGDAQETLVAVAAGDETITHFGIYDNASGGLYLLGGALNASIPAKTGDKLSWDTGDLIVRIN
jgi:hypothetical protein